MNWTADADDIAPGKCYIDRSNNASPFAILCFNFTTESLGTASAAATRVVIYIETEVTDAYTKKNQAIAHFEGIKTTIEVRYSQL